MTESNAYRFLIKDMVEEERPREKALKHGIKSLTNAELMAILFSTGVQGKSVIQLSNEILADSDGHLSKVARLSVNDFLHRYKGIGKAKALTLLAALELGARSEADARTVTDPKVLSSTDAYDIMKHHLQKLPHEEFWAMYLSRSGKVIKEVNISRGGTASTVVDVKIIMKHALDNLASSIILLHNHPSGNLIPSIEDDNLTSKISKAAKLLDMQVLDHLIITDGGFYSYSDKGRL